MLISPKMDFIQRLFLYTTFVCLLCVLVGLFRPWVMLWWEDTQNRKGVLKVYGTAAVICYVLYWITTIID